jgi:hypothetical protein
MQNSFRPIQELKNTPHTHSSEVDEPLYLLIKDLTKAIGKTSSLSLHSKDEDILRIRKEVLDIYSNEDDKVIFENTIKNVLEEAQYANIKDIYNNKISEETKNGFRKNVTEGAILLQKYNKGMSYSDALRQSIDLQMGGFYQYREDPSTFYNPMTWGEQPTYRHEYVNMEDLKLLDRSPMATTNYDADRVVDLLNNKKYIQNMKGKDNKPLKPVSSDRSFVDGDYEYFVEAVTPKDIQGNIIKGDDGEPLPPFFMWKYRRLEQ